MFKLYQRNFSLKWQIARNKLFSNQNSLLKLGDYYLCTILFFGSFVISCYYMVPSVCGVYHDDGIYLCTAKSIAEGKGYTLINLPDSPNQTKYPIFYPLLLSIIWKIYPLFPENIYPMQLFTSLLGSISILIFYLYMVNFNFCSRYIAFASCSTCITCSTFQFFSTNLLSEVPFSFLIVLNLWTMEKSIRNDSNSKRDEFFLGMLLALPFLCRTIGFTIILPGLLLYRKKFRSIKWLTIGVLSVVLPWILFSFTNNGSFLISSEKKYYTDYYGWYLTFGQFFLGKVIFTNILQIFIQSINLPAELIFELYKVTKNKILIVIIAFLGLIVWKKIIFCKSNFLKWFLVSYFFIVLLWPWPPSRFLIPILPFLIVSLYSSILRALKKVLKIDISILSISLIIIVVIISNVFYTYKSASNNRNFAYPMIKHSENQVKWEAFENIFAWIKINTAENDIIAYGIDPMAYLYTGRQAIRPFLTRPSSLFYGDKYPATGSIKDFCLILSSYNVKYFVQTAMPGFAEEEPFNKLINHFLVLCPDCLDLVYTGDDVRFKIFLINRDRIKKLES